MKSDSVLCIYVWSIRNEMCEANKGGKTGRIT